MTTVDEQKRKVEAAAKEGMSQAKEYGDRAYDELKTRVEERRGDVEDYARSNPMSALGIAFLIGMTAGAVLAAIAASSSNR
jgi:ElaB/YqjD/DUF883 family membrane-anchored ribosome-binding protein